MRYMVRIHFLASNNVAEYEALINGLHIAIELGI
jgi:ribonuclease HI